MNHRIQVFTKHIVCASKYKKKIGSFGSAKCHAKKMVCACWMQTVYGLFSFLEEKKLHTEHFSCPTLGFSFPPLLSLYLTIRSILFSLASQQEFNWFVFVFVSFSCIQIQFICAIGFSRQLSHLKWNALPFPRFHNFNGIFFSLVYMKWNEVKFHDIRMFGIYFYPQHLFTIFLLLFSQFWQIVLFWSWGSHNICLFDCAAHSCAQTSIDKLLKAFLLMNNLIII